MHSVRTQAVLGILRPGQIYRKARSPKIPRAVFFISSLTYKFLLATIIKRYENHLLQHYTHYYSRSLSGWWFGLSFTLLTPAERQGFFIYTKIICQNFTKG